MISTSNGKIKRIAPLMLFNLKKKHLKLGEDCTQMQLLFTLVL